MLEVLIGVGVGAVIVIGLVALLRRPREADPRLDRLLAEIAAVRGSSESMDRRVDELRRSVGERVSAVETRLVEGQKNVTDTLGSVHEKIGRVFQASERGSMAACIRAAMYVEKPSLSQRSSNHCIVTRSPNHWCATSW